LRRGPTSFERRFSEEFEGSLIVLMKTFFSSFEVFLQITLSTRMALRPDLHVSMPHVKKLADFRSRVVNDKGLSCALQRRFHQDDYFSYAN
jgi:hypothetical protein